MISDTRLDRKRGQVTTIMGFEVMRALRKGQAALFSVTQDIRGKARIVERAFGIGPGALAEAVVVIGEKLSLEPA